MNIGEAARGSGVSAKMIRHYESIGLLPQATRSDAGYRRYSDADLHTLRFIRHARDLGFDLETIGALVSLWQDRGRESREVKRLANAHITALREKLDQLQKMIGALEQLTACCHGDDRPECPILDELAGVAHA